jgi:AraC-like DNA-binding protein
MRVHMPIIREIVRGAARAGADVVTLCEAIGLKPDDLEDGKRFVELEEGHRAWQEAVRQTNDPLLGLHLGEQVSPTMIGLAGHLMQTSSTLAIALQQVVTFNHTFTDMFRYEWMDEGDTIQFIIEPAGAWWKLHPESARQARDQAASGTLHVCSLLADKRITPVRAAFTTRRNTHHTEYEKILGCPIRYQAPQNALTFSKRLLEMPIATHNQSLFKTFEALLRQQLREHQPSSLREQIRLLIETEFNCQPPSVDLIATRLHTTSRSLQRKLKEEGVRYRDVVADIRKNVAKTLLKESPEKIYTIATMLGYSDASTFRRAFKQWSKETPKKFRNR